jgi:hypothetical protein
MFERQSPPGCIPWRPRPAAEHGASIFKMMDVSRHKSVPARLRAQSRQFQRPCRGGVPVNTPLWVVLVAPAALLGAIIGAAAANDDCRGPTNV